MKSAHYIVVLLAAEILSTSVRAADESGLAALSAEIENERRLAQAAFISEELSPVTPEVLEKLDVESRVEAYRKEELAKLDSRIDQLENDWIRIDPSHQKGQRFRHAVSNSSPHPGYYIQLAIEPLEKDRADLASPNSKLTANYRRKVLQHALGILTSIQSENTYIPSANWERLRSLIDTVPLETETSRRKRVHWILALASVSIGTGFGLIAPWLGEQSDPIITKVFNSILGGLVFGLGSMMIYGSVAAPLVDLFLSIIPDANPDTKVKILQANLLGYRDIAVAMTDRYKRKDVVQNIKRVLLQMRDYDRSHNLDGDAKTAFEQLQLLTDKFIKEFNKKRWIRKSDLSTLMQYRLDAEILMTAMGVSEKEIRARFSQRVYLDNLNPTEEILLKTMGEIQFRDFKGKLYPPDRYEILSLEVKEGRDVPSTGQKDFTITLKIRIKNEDGSSEVIESPFVIYRKSEATLEQVSKDLAAGKIKDLFGEPHEDGVLSRTELLHTGGSRNRRTLLNLVERMSVPCPAALQTLASTLPADPAPTAAKPFQFQQRSQHPGGPAQQQ